MKANVKYEENDKGVFDYNLSNHKMGEICGFRNFDGTQKDIVFLGAAQTLGRYSHNPFPMLVEDNTKYTVANFGWGGVGDYQYSTPEFLDYINSSKLCVYQINSGRSTKNFNQTFDLGDTPINEIPPKIINLYKNNFSDFKSRLFENKKEYLESVNCLLTKIKIPVLFVYVSKHDLKQVDETKIINDQPMELLWNFPQFVTKQMVEEVTKGYDLGCFKQPKITRLPKSIIDNESPQKNNVFQLDDYYPDQKTHYDIAEYLIPKIKNLLK